MAGGRWIDIDQWKRRQHYDLYRSLPHPWWGLTAEVDVTWLWDACAREKRSFFLASSFAALGALNATEAFRLRIRPEGVWCHDEVGLSPTVMRDDETFRFSRLAPRPTFDEFEAESRVVMDRARQQDALEVDPDDAAVYSSALPWIRFTSFTNPFEGPMDSIPRLVFGKAAREGVSRRMPVGVEVHHALVDGLDVARFLQRFEAALAHPLW
jgi:chloramphenicol O-acetyltransferase type A